MAEWQTRQFEGLLGDEPVRVQLPLLALISYVVYLERLFGVEAVVFTLVFDVIATFQFLGVGF